LSPLLVAELVRYFLIALDKSLASDLLEIVQSGGLELDPMAVRIDYRMMQMSMNTCSFSCMIGCHTFLLLQAQRKPRALSLAC
jgi:hypothetical protein